MAEKPQTSQIPPVADVVEPGVFEPSFESYIALEDLEYQDQERQWLQVLPFMLLPLLMPLLAQHPIGRSVIGAPPAQVLLLCAPASLSMLVATAAYRLLGAHSTIYQSLDFLETLTIEVVIAVLIVQSGRIDSGIWFLYAVHALNVAHGPKPRRMHTLVLVLMPICVALYFPLVLGSGAHSVFALLAATMVGGAVMWARQSKKKSLRLGYERHVLLFRMASENLHNLRSAIAREIHDGLAADLSAIAWKADALWRADQDGDMHREGLRQIAERARRGLSEARSLVWGLAERTPTWAEVTRTVELRARELCDGKANLEFSRSGDESVHLPSGMSTDLLRMAQEMIRNALQHGEADSISVQLDLGKDCELQVQDNGGGFDEQSSSPGHGLNNLTMRTERRGGEIHIRPSNAGTLVHARLPLPSGRVEEQQRSA